MKILIENVLTRDNKYATISSTTEMGAPIGVFCNSNDSVFIFVSINAPMKVGGDREEKSKVEQMSTAQNSDRHRLTNQSDTLSVKSVRPNAKYMAVWKEVDFLCQVRVVTSLKTNSTGQFWRMLASAFCQGC